jgi:glycosyltransferase involved in cell wall biosynthesis
MTWISSSQKVKLTFFPDYRETNPYQTLLYEGLALDLTAEPGTIDTALNAIQRSTCKERHFYHLHWEHQALSDPDVTVEGFLNQLSQFQQAGGVVIWTVHNLMPHEHFAQQQIADLYEGLAEIADAILMHSLPASAAAQEMWKFSPAKIRIIPHANYAGFYPASNRNQSRDALGLEDARMVALLPGRIAEYKSPDALVATFSEVAGPNDHLIIAGHFANGMVLDTKDDPRIHLQAGFATVEEVSKYHAAAEFVVLPYAQSLTSGSAILAATLGRGVLGPMSPGLYDAVQHGETGILYDSSHENGMRDAMKAAFAAGPEVWAARGRAATIAAVARDQQLVTNAWRDLISLILRSTPPVVLMKEEL